MEPEPDLPALWPQRGDHDARAEHRQQQKQP